MKAPNLILSAIASLLSVSGNSQSTNYSFEAPGFTNTEDRIEIRGSTSELISGWNINVWGNAYANWIKAPTYAVDDGQYALRLSTNGWASSFLNIVPGHRYRASLRAAGAANPGFLNLAAGNVVTNFGPIPTNSGFGTYEFDFTADTGDPGTGTRFDITVFEAVITVDNLSVVPAPPVPPLVAISVSQVDVCWATETNRTYQVERRATGSSGPWTLLGAPISGPGGRTCIVDTVRGELHQFYRVRVVE